MSELQQAKLLGVVKISVGMVIAYSIYVILSTSTIFTRDDIAFILVIWVYIIWAIGLFPFIVPDAYEEANR